MEQVYSKNLVQNSSQYLSHHRPELRTLGCSVQMPRATKKSLLEPKYATLNTADITPLPQIVSIENKKEVTVHHLNEKTKRNWFSFAEKTDP